MGILYNQAMARRRHVNDQLVYWEPRPVLITMDRVRRLFEIVKHFDRDAVIESGDNLIRHPNEMYELVSDALRLSIHGHESGVHVFLGHHFTLVTATAKDDLQHAAVNRLRLELENAVRPAATTLIHLAPFILIAVLAACAGILSTGYSTERLVICGLALIPALLLTTYAVIVGVFGRVRIRLYGSGSWWSEHGGQVVLNIIIAICSVVGTLLAQLISR